MPKAILKFKLPEESSEFKCAIKGMDFASVILDVLEMLKRKLDVEEDETKAKTLETIRDEITSIMYGHDVDYDDLLD